MALSKLDQIKGLGGSEIVRRLTPSARLERLALVENHVAVVASFASLRDAMTLRDAEIKDLRETVARMRAQIVDQVGELDRLRVAGTPVTLQARIAELEAELQRVRARDWSEPDVTLQAADRVLPKSTQTCPVCAARKAAQRARTAKARKGQK